MMVSPRPEVAAVHFEARDYEKTITQIKAVLSARVITGERENIEAIHVLAGSGRSPKQIVRDIESAVMARFGIQVNHKKISVAQVHDEDAEVGAPRIRLVAVNVGISGAMAEAKVHLKVADDLIEGVASGPASKQNRLRLVASGTLNALERYLKGSCVFTVEDVSVITIANRSAVVVAVTLVTPTGEDYFLGSAFVREDDREAVAKATLDAINRQVAVWVRN